MCFSIVFFTQNLTYSTFLQFLLIYFVHLPSPDELMCFISKKQQPKQTKLCCGTIMKQRGGARESDEEENETETLTRTIAIIL